MTCQPCNQDCNQGRDCPAATTRKVKAYPDVPADPPPFEYVPTWRDYLPDLARAMLLVVAVVVVSSAATVIVLGVK